MSLRTYKYGTAFAALLGVAVALCSCGKDDGEKRATLAIAPNKSGYVARTATGLFLSVRAAGVWNITFEYPSGTTPWCTISAANASGTGDKSNVWVSFPANVAADSRLATVRIASGGQDAAMQLVQFGTSPPVIPGSMELPLIGDPEQVYAYQYGLFTLEYSNNDRLAKWVAWKLHTGMLGSVKRTEAWSYDARIPAAYRPGANDFQGYDRGHMCPSADRTRTEAMNRETFYYTNMQPQDHGLNAGVWADVENRCRAWIKNTRDTLFICAGGVNMTTRTGQMSIPQNYFKAILRHKASGAWDAIGFWFGNRTYTHESVTAAETRSIDWLETQTGLDFFYNLNPSTQTTVEANANPSSWGIN